MSGGEVSYESRDGVAIVTIKRPEKLNAISGSIGQQLEDAWLRFENGPDRVAILAGAQGNFTAGMDVSNAPQGGGWAPNLAVPLSKPVIAAVEGWCIGAGIIALQQVDLAIAASDARFRYPEARIGLTRGYSVGLAAKMPHKLAMELMLLGRITSADALCRAGLVNLVVEPGQALEHALLWARELAEADIDAVRFIKSAVDRTLPRGPGELAERARWESAQLPANRRLIAGEFSVADLKEV